MIHELWIQWKPSSCQQWPSAIVDTPEHACRLEALFSVFPALPCSVVLLSPLSSYFLIPLCMPSPPLLIKCECSSGLYPILNFYWMVSCILQWHQLHQYSNNSQIWINNPFLSSENWVYLCNWFTVNSSTFMPQLLQYSISITAVTQTFPQSNYFSFFVLSIENCITTYPSAYDRNPSLLPHPFHHSCQVHHQDLSSLSPNYLWNQFIS